MSLRHLKKRTAAVAVAACVFAASGAGAAETSADQRGGDASASFSDPVSAPCHPALRACAPYSQRIASAAQAPVGAYRQDARVARDFEWAPCHAALNVCLSWGRNVRASESEE